MGVDFPDSLRASLLRHNGSRGTGAFGFGAWFDGAVNLGIRDIRDTWRALCANHGTDPAIGWWRGGRSPSSPSVSVREGTSSTPWSTPSAARSAGTTRSPAWPAPALLLRADGDRRRQPGEPYGVRRLAAHGHARGAALGESGVRTARSRSEPRYFLAGTGLPPGRTAGGGKRSLRICRARIAA